MLVWRLWVSFQILSWASVLFIILIITHILQNNTKAKFLSLNQQDNTLARCIIRFTSFENESLIGTLMYNIMSIKVPHLQMIDFRKVNLYKYHRYLLFRCRCYLVLIFAFKNITKKKKKNWDESVENDYSSMTNLSRCSTYHLLFGLTLLYSFFFLCKEWNEDQLSFTFKKFNKFWKIFRISVLV